MVVDPHNARTIAREFVDFRKEDKYPGPYTPTWSNHPNTLHRALTNLFHIWGALVLALPSVIDELLRVAMRAKDVASRLAHWSIENNTYFWRTTLDQFDEIVLGVGLTIHSSGDFVAALSRIPDFIDRDEPRRHLQHLEMESFKLSMQNRSSHLLTLDTELLPSVDPTLPPTDAVPSRVELLGDHPPEVEKVDLTTTDGDLMASAVDLLADCPPDEPVQVSRHRHSSKAVGYPGGRYH